MPAAKQVIYVDVDDEITGIIDKMNGADARVVALVLPKRASVFQSVVNMKLLKRRAEQANKHLVLITSEAGLMPLAGLAGVYVAPTLQSKPAIPAGPDESDLPDDSDDQPVSLSDDFSASRNAATPVGALAAGAAPGVNDLPDDVEELDKASPAGRANGKLSPQMAAAAAAGKDKAGKDKKLAVPNFTRFRKRLIFGGLALVALIALWYVAWFVMPTAQVTVKTRTSDIDLSLDLRLDTVAKTVDAEELVVPAKLQQQEKDNTQQVPATGTENKGEKASGSVTMTASVCGTPATPQDVPAGSGISAGAQTFITQATASFEVKKIESGCIRFEADPVPVVAQKGGAAYNVNDASFAVANRQDVAATGTTAGGTDNTVKVIQQADIDAAKEKLSSPADRDAAKQALRKALQDLGYLAVQTSFHTGSEEPVTSAKVGDEAEAVTVSQTVTYSMYGVKKADLRKIIEAEAADKIDKSRQSIIDDGIDKARFGIESPAATPQLTTTMNATAVAGPQIDVEQVKQDMVGKKSGVVRDEIKANPGVEDVEVTYKPFWVTKAPKPEKTTVVFEKVGEAASPATDKADDEAGSATDDTQQEAGTTESGADE